MRGAGIERVHAERAIELAVTVQAGGSAADVALTAQTTWVIE
jgi:hypothetical protein